ncbi:hypothetical protein D6777_04305 [Candidatus Woesearchaeota archaeon]|nr:MAG: hypothetical protein D6777_04305 [Candidatus Woesearchaeota archaeon]
MIKSKLKSLSLAVALALAPATVKANTNKPNVQQVKTTKPNRDIQKPNLEQRINSYENKFEKHVILDKKITYNTKWWEYLIYIPLAYATTVLWHESGHAVVAKAFGYKEIKLMPPNFKKGYILSVQAKMPTKPTTLETDIFAGSGVAFTTLGNVALTTLLRHDAVPKKLRPFVATTSLMMMLDRWRYVLTSAKNHFFYKSYKGDDIDMIISNHYKSKRGKDIAYGVLTGLTLLEMGLRYEEIKYLVYTIIGREEKVERNEIYVRATPIYSGAMLNVSGNFDENKLLK